MMILAQTGDILYKPMLSQLHFFVLTFSVVIIAAAGYIINDYFDVKTDEINKPHKIFIGRKISRRKAMLVHVVFSFLGILLGLYCSISAGKWYLVLYHIFTWFFLWIYSVYLKRKLIVGNILIALLTSIVVWLVFEYESHGLKTQLNESTFLNIQNICIYFALFAFMVNLIREIIKDAEDIKGDLIIKSNTIPIKYGLKTTRYICIALAVLSTLFIFQFFTGLYKLIQTPTLLEYIPVILFLFLFFPLLIFRIFKADRNKDFSAISNFLKLIMLMGIMSLLLFIL